MIQPETVKVIEQRHFHSADRILGGRIIYRRDGIDGMREIAIVRHADMRLS